MTEQKTARLEIAGHKPVSVQTELRVVAINRDTEEEQYITIPAVPTQEFSFPADIGNGVINLAENVESDEVVAYRVSCSANLNTNWILFEVSIIFKFPAMDFSAIIPSGWGRKIDNFPADFLYKGIYPCWSCLAQLMILQGSNCGASVSVRDKNFEIKYLYLSQKDRFTEKKTPFFCLEVARVPELNNGKWEVKGECDILLSSHSGGWDVAATNYRAEQEKIRSELGQKKGQHSFIKNDPFWLTYNCFAYPEHTLPQMLEAIENLDGPTMLHLYNWSDYAFDSNYPELLKDRVGLTNEIETLQNAGARCHPYFNGRLWDTTIESYKSSGKESAVVNANGKIETEIYSYSSNIDLAVNCPSQTQHHDSVIESAVEFSKRLNTYDGVYLDQIGAAPGLRCYAKNHGHPQGGAKSWNQGQRIMMEKLIAELRKEYNATPFITTENPSEPLVDLIDGYLYFCGKPHEEIGIPIPLWQNIYGDITHNFADNFGKFNITAKDSIAENTKRLYVKLGRQVIFGNAIGWISPNLLTGDYSHVCDFMNNARTARLPFLDFFKYGHIIPAALDSTGEKTGVLRSAWRYKSDIVEIIVNTNSEEVKTIGLDGTPLSLVAGETSCIIQHL